VLGVVARAVHLARGKKRKKNNHPSWWRAEPQLDFGLPAVQSLGLEG